MSRPRKDDPRQHQVNVRFTAHEYMRIHRHASLTGKTLTDFSRGVMLRRPRIRRRQQLQVLALPPSALARLHALGSAINELAHGFHAAGQLNPRIFGVLMTRLRLLLRRSFSQRVDIADTAYALAPATRYQLRKLCTNLVQVADRFRALGLAPPLTLSNQIARMRLLINKDGAAHGA